MCTRDRLALVGGVVEAGAKSGARLDGELDPGLLQQAGRLRNQRNATFTGGGLERSSDEHGAAL